MVNVSVTPSVLIKIYLSGVNGKNNSFCPALIGVPESISPFAVTLTVNDFLIVILESFKLMVATFGLVSLVYNVLSEEDSNVVPTIFMSETLTTPDAGCPPSTTPLTVWTPITLT